MDETLLSPDTNTPSEFRSSDILFLRNLWATRLWKNLELLSPETIQWSWLLCCHSFSSIRSRSWTSDFSLRKASFPLPYIVATLAYFNRCFFLSQRFWHITDGRLLHCIREVRHASILVITLSMGKTNEFDIQALSTVLCNLYSPATIARNAMVFGPYHKSLQVE